MFLSPREFKVPPSLNRLNFSWWSCSWTQRDVVMILCGWKAEQLWPLTPAGSLHIIMKKKARRPPGSDGESSSSEQRESSTASDNQYNQWFTGASDAADCYRTEPVSASSTKIFNLKLLLTSSVWWTWRGNCWCYKVCPYWWKHWQNYISNICDQMW